MTLVSRELATGVPIVYKLDKEGNYISKEILDYVCTQSFFQASADMNQDA